MVSLSGFRKYAFSKKPRTMPGLKVAGEIRKQKTVSISLQPGCPSQSGRSLSPLADMFVKTTRAVTKPLRTAK